MRFAILAALILAGCGEAVPSALESADDPAAGVMQAEAAKACAEMTNYNPENLRDKSAETQALMQREYDHCVAAVAEDQAPALRGRTTAP